MRTAPRPAAASVLAGLLTLAAGQPAAAQPPPGVVSVAVGSGTSVDELRRWDAAVDAMTRTGELVVLSRQADRTLPGRTHEYLAQFYGGVRVRGGGVSRQLDGGATVSLFGTLHTAIDVDTAPALTAGEAVRRAARRVGAAPVDRRAPGLFILPLLDGSYALAYRLTLDDAHIYFASAVDGAIVHAEPAFDTQSSSVGVGVGFRGDAKKIATRHWNGRFEAHDRLRPGGIVTLDVGFDDERRARLTERGPWRVQRWTSSDIASDADDDWSDEAVVDGHVHMGWTYDYFAQRHGWWGVDGRRGRIVGMVNNDVNNAYAYAPPFGPEGAGVYVFGLRGSQPRVALHTVAHELMHGVTYFSVARRTGSGLFTNVAVAARPGPSSFDFEGVEHRCPETRFLIRIRGEWQSVPALCGEDGRFVLASSQGRAVNEAYSDIFGVAAGFFHEAAGATGSYEYGSDYAAGTLRSLSAPGSLGDPADYRHRFEFALANDGRYSYFSGALFQDRTLVGWAREFCCYGAQHWNSTILSHAFYLAVEGGRSQGSGLAVEGAGAANREHVERIFFRAMTEMTPAATSLPEMADVIRQAAADLAAGSPVQRAVEQALRAVGLPPTPAGRP